MLPQASICKTCPPVWPFVVRFLPQQLSLALQAVQQLNLAVHVSDVILKVLTGDIYLLAELSKHTGQLPDNHRQKGHKGNRGTLDTKAFNA